MLTESMGKTEKVMDKLWKSLGILCLKFGRHSAVICFIIVAIWSVCGKLDNTVNGSSYPSQPYSVLKYSTVIGVMVTASHNPKEDNGYKVRYCLTLEEVDVA